MSEQSSANGWTHEDQDSPLSTPQILVQEALAIDPDIADQLLKDVGPTEGYAGGAADEQRLYQALGRLDRAALCLSGGGIRSAAFSLGVIQALATHPRPNKQRSMFEEMPAQDASPQEETPEARDKAIAAARAVHETEADRRTVRASLARKNLVIEPKSSLLAQLHYLSSVSGGGYIASWLSAWRYRESFEAVRNNLVGRPDGPDVEPHAL